ncbi:MAG: FkbM family methyltransferase [Candidatus Zeuxoniibacter abyssi]|nr:MAG: FkbM family methyltransferase [Candidatus Persebacteraceae bacterium AB1(2)]
MTKIYLNDNTVYFNVSGSVFTLYDPGRTVAAEIFSNQGYEPSVIDLLDRAHERQQPNTVFCDIGALHGYYPSLIRSRYPEWIVHAFEPNPIAYETLKYNFDLNTIRGEAYCLVMNDNGKSLHFKGRTIVSSSEPDFIIVNGITFDQFANKINIQNAIVKIDVHGAEGLVLSGMRNSLGTVAKDVLIEVHAQHLLVDLQTYADMLELLGQGGLTVWEVANFRNQSKAELVPLVGINRDKFTDFSKWEKHK